MRRLAALFALVIALVPGLATAQNAPEIDTLFVELWPEYDRAAMLVIYRIQLSEQTTLPATLAVRIPAAVGEPNAVAEAAAAGGLVNAVYEREVEGEWATLLIETTTGIVQVEYYDPALTKDGAGRTYSDVLEFDYPIGRLLVRVQQPPTASNMQITPAGTAAIEGDGLTYYYSEFGAIAVGETIAIFVAYEKDDDALTVGSLAAETAPDEPASSANGKQALAWGLGILGAVILGYAGFRLWQDSRADSKRVTSRGRRGTGRATWRGTTVFCHNCGVQSRTGDRYCRECGTELRKA